MCTVSWKGGSHNRAIYFCDFVRWRKGTLCMFLPGQCVWDKTKSTTRDWVGMGANICPYLELFQTEMEAQEISNTPSVVYFNQKIQQSATFGCSMVCLKCWKINKLHREIYFSDVTICVCQLSNMLFCCFCSGNTDPERARSKKLKKLIFLNWFSSAFELYEYLH